MKENYAAAEDHVLASEGGYTHDARDPGGPTNWGITIYDARLYWKHNATAQDVRNMPKSVAQDIYKKKYWNALDCDDLPSGLDYTVFDYGVNSGIGRAGKVLRRCMGMQGSDWHVTHDMIEALGKRDIGALIKEINDERIGFLRRLGTWSHFGNGWSARVASVRAISLRMFVDREPVPAPLALPGVQQAGKGVEHADQLVNHLASSSWEAVNNTSVA